MRKQDLHTCDGLIIVHGTVACFIKQTGRSDITERTLAPKLLTSLGFAVSFRPQRCYRDHPKGFNISKSDFYIFEQLYCIAKRKHEIMQNLLLNFFDIVSIQPFLVKYPCDQATIVVNRTLTGTDVRSLAIYGHVAPWPLAGRCRLAVRQNCHFPRPAAIVTMVTGEEERAISPRNGRAPLHRAPCFS